MAIKTIVLLGPESTGKTTLCEALSAHFQSPFAHEYLRSFCENNNRLPLKTDMEMIAKGQFKNQNDAFEKAKDWVFFDTDLLSLSVYHQHYFNERLSRIPNWKKSPSLTLLLYPDIPWVSEPLRDRPEKREELFELFKAEIEKENRTYLIIKGSDKQRFDSALSAILEWNQHLK